GGRGVWQCDSRFSGSMTIPARWPVYGASGQGRAGNHGNAGEAVPDMPSQLAARLDEVWAAIKTGLVRGLSVGFRSP
ncbi:putative head protein/prohead protease, partial [Escherichia coli O55:H7 str. USDA 5905]